MVSFLTKAYWTTTGMRCCEPQLYSIHLLKNLKTQYTWLQGEGIQKIEAWLKIQQNVHEGDE